MIYRNPSPALQKDEKENFEMNIKLGNLKFYFSLFSDVSIDTSCRRDRRRFEMLNTLAVKMFNDAFILKFQIVIKI